MTRLAVISQARMTSTRLPGKVLLEVGGKSYLQHHVERVRASGLDLIIATTTNEADLPIVERCADWGVPVFRGSEHDVLSRYVGAVNEFELDVVVRVTSDCPLIDGDVLRTGVDKYVEAADPNTYVSNTLTRTFPRGFDYEVFSALALAHADAVATSTAHREHVTPYLYENLGASRLVGVVRSADRSSYRLTLDTPADHALLTTLIEVHEAASLSCAQIIEVMDTHPDLALVNGSVTQKGVYDG